MANAMLFYRTPDTAKSITAYDTVAKLLAAKPDQCLLFTPPEDLAKLLNDDYTNNIVRKVPTQPFNRIVRQSDQGVSGWLINLEGDFYGDTGDATDKLYAFAQLPQGDSVHLYGCFGITYPNGPARLQTIDPDPSHGLMIVNRKGAHTGVTKNLVDFSCQLSYGGDVTING